MNDSFNSNLFIAKTMPMIVRDNFVGIHSFNVGMFTHGMAQVLLKSGVLSEEDEKILKVEGLPFMAGFSHDLGKLYVEDAILNKDSKLSSSEFSVIKNHPLYGMQYLTKEVNNFASESILQVLADAIYYHHERWDGKGYPCSISGTDIPMIARLISISDSYDAMTNVRPYREPLTFKAAIRELKQNAGTQFDPLFVEIVLDAVKKGTLSLRK